MLAGNENERRLRLQVTMPLWLLTWMSRVNWDINW